MSVPNQFPEQTSVPYRIALVGEAPGEDEVREQKPFIGMSGRFLRALLSKSGISATNCFIGNVCQIRPPSNNIKLFDWEGDELTSGRLQLREDLLTYRPNLVILLGGTALRAASTNELSIDAHRGSLFRGDDLGIAPGFKCLSTYHPAAALRMYDYVPLMNFDFRKAERQGRFPELNLPKRTIDISLPADILVQKMRSIRESRATIALDIEGGIQQGMTCICICESATYGFVVPFFFGQWNAWDTETEAMLVRELAVLLSDPNVPKVLQNSLYDLFVLAWHLKIVVRGLADDTMLKHWELLCEMEKGLGVQASIYTDEPYYKGERKTDSREVYFLYNGKDGCVTKEINEITSKELNGGSLSHYKLNVALLTPLLYIQLCGISYNVEASIKALNEAKVEIFELQHELNKECGCALTNDPNPLFTLAKETFCFKKDLGKVLRFADIVPNSKTTCYHLARRFLDILTEAHKAGRELTNGELGEMSTLLECHINVDSPKQMVELLYTKRRLTEQFKKLHGKRTDSLSTDVLALLKLTQKHPDDKVVPLILRLRSLMTSTETLGNKCDYDNRIRCAYNIVGTDTGRLSCYESPTGSGFNLQTVTKKKRYLFRADDSFDMFQCDLSGADGWTVAANCASLGDRTMLDDYIFGLKPAKIGALMFLGYDTQNMSRDELKKLSKDVKDGEATDLCPHEWLYFGFKRVQHGSNYLMGPNTMSDQIVKDSYKMTGKVTFIPPEMCARLQRLYLTRYRGVLQWHRTAQSRLKQQGFLISASGHKRIFLGRRDENETLKKWLAHEPQANTTYACNLALHKLWNDPNNRRSNGSLIIEPLHQVHDALIGQWPRDDASGNRDTHMSKVRSYFNNPLTIAGITLTIPFEGAWGKSWGELTNPI